MLNLLLDKLTKEFPKWGKTCIKNMLLVSLCMLEKETSCLYKLKNAVGKHLGNLETTPSSHYKRLTRFFTDYAYSRLWIDLLGWVFRLLNKTSVYLVLDGTSWEKGETRHHYLVLSVVYGNVAIPIYWEDLRKKGVSNQKERKRLFRKAKKYFNLKGKILLADREYIGVDWFKFLLDNDIDFLIRLRYKNYKKAVNQAKGKSYEQLEAKVLRSKKRAKAVGKRIKLNGMNLNFVLMKNPKQGAKESIIYFISSLDGPPPTVACRYPIRWKIESCFKHLKSNGFELEKANVRGKAKDKLLLAVIVFAYTLSILEGLKTYKKVPNKKYQTARIYKAISLFRYGLDTLVATIPSFIHFCSYLIHNLVENRKHYLSPNSIFVQ